MSYSRSRFQPGEADELARFISRQRAARRASDPDAAAQVTAAHVLREAGRAGCLGIFLLKRNGTIAASMQVDETLTDGRIAVLSGLEVAPVCGGAFWRHLGTPLIRALVQCSFDRLEVAADCLVEDRDIASLRRTGFRLATGAGVRVMANYLPAIIRHPAVRPFMSRGSDFLETLDSRPCDRADDGIRCGRLSLFAYSWTGPDPEDTLQILVDRERHQVVSIERRDWAACCFTAAEHPFRIHYRIRNKLSTTIAFCVEKRSGDCDRSRLQSLLPGQTSSGDIFIVERAPPASGAAVNVEIAGERVPFQLRRSIALSRPRVRPPPSSSPRFPSGRCPSQFQPAASGA